MYYNFIERETIKGKGGKQLKMKRLINLSDLNKIWTDEIIRRLTVFRSRTGCDYFINN
jgi:hypothetical protein